MDQIELKRHAKKTKYIAHASYLIILLACGFILLIIFWLLYPYKPLVVDTVSIQPQTVRAGEIIYTHTKFCIYTNKPIKINTDLVGKLVVIELPPRDIQVTYPKGCDEIDAIRQLPIIKNVGVFHLENTATIKVNPIREVQVKWRSENIEIVEATEEISL